MRKGLGLLAAGAVLCWVSLGWADVIYLHDGSVIKGTILKLDEKQVAVQTAGGVLTLSRDSIAKTLMGEEPASPAPAAGTLTPAATPSPVQAAVPEEDFSLYHGRSFYAERKLGVGFAGGFSSGSGLSAILHLSPVALVLSGTPVTDGYYAGAQLQMDLLQYQYQRVYAYSGTSWYESLDTSTHILGLGLGYGWIDHNFLGYTFNGGIQGLRRVRGDEEEDKMYWYPDINAMLHFYVW